MVVQLNLLFIIILLLLLPKIIENDIKINKIYFIKKLNKIMNRLGWYKLNEVYYRYDKNYEGYIINAYKYELKPYLKELKRYFDCESNLNVSNSQWLIDDLIPIRKLEYDEQFTRPETVSGNVYGSKLFDIIYHKILDPDKIVVCKKCGVKKTYKDIVNVYCMYCGANFTKFEHEVKG